MNDRIIKEILADLKQATLAYRDEQGEVPAAVAFQQGVKWAIQQIKEKLQQEEPCMTTMKAGTLMGTDRMGGTYIGQSDSDGDDGYKRPSDAMQEIEMTELDASNAYKNAIDEIEDE